MEIISKYVEVHVVRKFNNKPEFLMLKRSGKEIYGGLWQIVTGKIKKGEKAFESALREMKEETGLIPKRFWTAPNVNSFYSYEEDCVIILPVFAALVDETDKVIISKEHTEFKWTNPGKAKTMLAWPGQRKSIDIIENYMMNESNFLKFVEIHL